MTASDLTTALPVSVLAGLVGTGGMTAAMSVIDRLGLANAKMVVAIGSLLTRSRDRATGVGLVMHVTAGIGFAVLYTAGLLMLGVRGLGPCVGMGAVFGFVHGFAMSFILVVAVAEHHPRPEFRQAGFAVAAAHVVGHVVYGALVGLVLGLAALSGQPA